MTEEVKFDSEPIKEVTLVDAIKLLNLTRTRFWQLRK